MALIMRLCIPLAMRMAAAAAASTTMTAVAAAAAAVYLEPYPRAGNLTNGATGSSMMMVFSS